MSLETTSPDHNGIKKRADWIEQDTVLNILVQHRKTILKIYLLENREQKECFCVLCPQVNGTEIEYEFEEITLERVSIFLLPQRRRVSENSVGSFV